MHKTGKLIFAAAATLNLKTIKNCHYMNMNRLHNVTGNATEPSYLDWVVRSFGCPTANNGVFS